MSFKEVNENCTIEGVIIYDCSDCMYKNVVFNKVVIQNIDFTHCVFVNCKFIKCEFGTKCCFHECECNNCEFYKCYFDGGDAHSSTFNKCKFTKCKYTDNCCIAYTKYYDCVMYKCKLQLKFIHCLFTNLDLSTCKFTKDLTIYQTALSHAKLPKKEQYRTGVCLTKPILGYKVTHERIVVVAEIPAGAMVYSVNGHKCRTNLAHVKEFRTIDNKKSTATVASSLYDFTFKYHVGDDIHITDFDRRHYIECAAGFHFFKTFAEAVEYYD